MTSIIRVPLVKVLAEVELVNNDGAGISFLNLVPLGAAANRPGLGGCRCRGVAGVDRRRHAGGSRRPLGCLNAVVPPGVERAAVVPDCRVPQQEVGLGGSKGARDIDADVSGFGLVELGARINQSVLGLGRLGGCRAAGRGRGGGCRRDAVVDFDAVRVADLDTAAVGLHTRVLRGSGK